MKDYLEVQGTRNIRGCKDTTREAFKVALISDGELWMEMIQSRNISSQPYDDRIADQLVDAIIKHYFPLFVSLQTAI